MHKTGAVFCFIFIFPFAVMGAGFGEDNRPELVSMLRNWFNI